MLGRIQGRKGRFSVRLSLLAALALPAAMPAQAQQGTIHGGPGGRYFEYTCPAGWVLVGVRGSAGILLDNIQAICGRVGQGNQIMESSAQGPVFGGNRPLDKGATCPAAYAITLAIIAENDSNPHVGAIKLTCTELVNRQYGGNVGIDIRGSGNLAGYESTTFFSPGRDSGTDSEVSACNGQYAVGIRGRAQNYLDAFGLVCGQAVAVADPGPPKTLGKRKRATILAKDPNAFSTTTSIPQAPRTLGKRKRPGSWGTPPAEQTGGAGASLNSDGNVGAYTKGSGWTGTAPPSQPTPPVEAQQAMPPSPMIDGTYSTVVEVNDSRCIIQDMRGSSQRVLQFAPGPGIVIPLNTFSNFFGGPVTLNVEGLNLSQSTTIPMMFGPASSDVPAEFDGAFTPDGAQFNVSFRAGNNLCRVGGSIRGQRQD
jgi:hypothetical protein